MSDETQKEVKSELFSAYDELLINLDYVYGAYSDFTADDIKNILRDPIRNHDITSSLSRYLYNTNGLVSNSIDYITAMPCLDRIVTVKKKPFIKFISNNKANANKELMLETLDLINDEKFIRDALFRDMVDGICFYYLETIPQKKDKRKYLNDWEVTNIMEISELESKAMIISLPYEYCKIIGRKNSRYQIAFNLDYFSINTHENIEELKKRMPHEIQRAYDSWSKSPEGKWYVLDNEKTIVHKIKCKDSEPWGRPFAISSFIDILYSNEFQNAKRNVLMEMNNKVVYQTYPEGEKKGTCSLSKDQQINQHSVIKNAIGTKNNYGGTSFFSIASGTKLDTLKVTDTTIFDSKNEEDLMDTIATDLGVSASLLNGSGSGTYASQKNNLDLIFAQVFSWVKEIQKELNYVINKNIIKDPKNQVFVNYLQTSLANRGETFKMMESLYTKAGGSLSFLIASTGINPDVYMSVLDEEIDSKIYDRYLPHQTSFTMSGDGSKTKEKVDIVDNENTNISKTNDSNNTPRAN